MNSTTLLICLIISFSNFAYSSEKETSKDVGVTEKDPKVTVAETPINLTTERTVQESGKNEAKTAPSKKEKSKTP
jgi:hypothetical protein